MHDTTLYASILGVEAPWKVMEVIPRLDEGESVVRVEAPAGVKLGCPECGTVCPRHDHRTRRWRHLPTCQYRTILEVAVPRVRCEAHGVHQVSVPWADSNSAFTALYEALVISWLKEASISAVAELMQLSWDQVDGIMQRAVRRGLGRRTPEQLRRIGIDETSFQKRHEYVTGVTEQLTRNRDVGHPRAGTRRRTLTFRQPPADRARARRSAVLREDVSRADSLRRAASTSARVPPASKSASTSGATAR